MESKQSFTLVRWFRTPMDVAALASLVLLALYLTIWHTAHFISALPFLLLLACPLMHLFMHGGHSGHGGHDASGDQLACGAHAERSMHQVVDDVDHDSRAYSHNGPIGDYGPMIRGPMALGTARTEDGGPR
jgi:hypothetical protein